MPKLTSPHILGTSANLLGFCLFVITSLKIANQTENHMVDEFTAVVAFMLTLSCVFSFVSMRTLNLQRGERYERIADYIFIVSLVSILLIIALITLNFIA